jgi:hypothetical protein
MRIQKLFISIFLLQFVLAFTGQAQIGIPRKKWTKF